MLDTQNIFPLSVWNESALFQRENNQHVIIGLFMGLSLVVVLFNTLFFVSTRDRAYLYYVFFVLSYALFELAFRSISGEYLWPLHSWIDNDVEVAASSLAVTMGLIFARKFLETKIWAPFMHRVLGVAILLGGVNTFCTLLFPFISYADPATVGGATESFWLSMTMATNTYLLLTVIVLVPNAFVVLRRGFRPARFYLAAWLLLLCGGIIFSLLNFGLVPSNPFTRNALSVSASLEMVLLFLAIGDRYLLLRRENEKNQRERLEAVEKRLYSDPLTELPNRNRLKADLQPGKFVTIILVNIDHFNDINDCFGQEVGDFVIKELGNRVQGAVADYHGTVYRLHSGEFAVIIDFVCNDATLAQVGRLLVARCQDEPYRCESETLRPSVSVGAAVTDSRHLEKADMALSIARSKKTLVNYRPDFEVVKRYAENLRWLYVIRESIESRLQTMQVDASQAGLTEREHEIALLLSERLSMREIAERLSISRRTVEKHAENIYLKLGIRRKQEVGEHLLNLRPYSHE
jgi:diguanylate cyclase (GGDEF)-like protein